jgi:hypothetical protein
VPLKLVTPLNVPHATDPPEFRLIVRPVEFTASLKFSEMLTAPPALYCPFAVVEVALVTVGVVLSTRKVVLGPAAAALLPAVSVAVPAAIEIPSVPSPVRLLIVTVRVTPDPVTPTVPFAVPVLLSVTSPVASVLVLKLISVYVTVKLTGPTLDSVAEGAPIVTVGPVVSLNTVVSVRSGAGM